MNYDNNARVNAIPVYHYNKIALLINTSLMTDIIMDGNYNQIKSNYHRWYHLHAFMLHVMNLCDMILPVNGE